MKRASAFGVSVPSILLLSVLSFGPSFGCQPPPTFRAAEGAVGMVRLALTVAPGVTLNDATYTITAPGFSRAGSLDVGDSATLSGTIGGLPAGDGYAIAVAATLSDGTTTCAGSAPFDVSAGALTPVSLHLLCHEPARTGGIQVGGTVNICPLVDALSASPGEVKVGGAIALIGTAHDTDGAPAPLRFLWTATGGTFSDPTAASSRFTCAIAGDTTITLTVSDGDCSDSATLTATCSPSVVPRPAIVINEVESSGGDPGDWVELFNAGTTDADLSGWIFKDNDDTHAYSIPTGTTLLAGARYLLEEAALGFGLGAADAARLYDASGTSLIDSYSWTAHAATTYGRCPDGVGSFTTTVAATKGSANECAAAPADGGVAGDDSGSDDAGNGDGNGDGGAVNDDSGAAADGGVATLPWPGANAAVLVDEAGQFGGNMSGLSYDPATPAGPPVLWMVQNGPSTLYRLVASGSTWTSTPDNDWIAGKALHYPDGSGAPDAEGVTSAEAGTPALYVSTERDNDANTVSRLSVLRFDTGALGPTLTATHEWNLTADLPAVDPNLGLEAITWIPDDLLVASHFVDETTGQPYDPSNHPNHGGGIFLVGLEANGTVYGYALDHAGGGFQRIATFEGGQASIMDLSFDRDTGYLWAYCDNTCGNRAAVLQIDGDATSATGGRFVLSRIFDHPSTLPDVNNEGIAIAPDAECSNGLKAFFWSDDAATGGHSLRRDTIPCGRFF